MKSDEKTRFVCGSCGKEWPKDYCPECAQAINCKIETNRHVSQGKPAEPAIPAPPVSSYLTDFNSIKLAENYVISPRDHSVDDPTRALKKYPRKGLSNVIISLVIGLVLSVVIYFLGFLIEPVAKSIPSFLWEFYIVRAFFSVLANYVPLLVVLCPPICLFFGINSLYKSCIRPTLSTPKKAIECFLRSTDVDLYERAYNLLTDQAQKLGKLDLNESDHVFAKKIPKEVTISDLSSFEDWWTGVRLCWPPKWKKLVRHDISPDVCVLEFPVRLSYPKACGELLGEPISFNAVFPMIQRERMWFVVKPFIWPFGGFRLVKKYAKSAATITSKDKSSQEEMEQTDHPCELKHGKSELDELEKANIIGRRSLSENCGAVYRVLSKSQRHINKSDKVHAMGTLNCSVCAKNFKVDFEVAFKGYFDVGSKQLTKCIHCGSSIQITGHATEIVKGKPKFWLIVLRETAPVNAHQGEFRLVFNSLSAIEEPTTPPQVTPTGST